MIWPDPTPRGANGIERPTDLRESLPDPRVSEALALVAAILVGQEELISRQEELIARLEEIAADSPDVERAGPSSGRPRPSRRNERAPRPSIDAAPAAAYFRMLTR